MAWRRGRRSYGFYSVFGVVFSRLYVEGGLVCVVFRDGSICVSCCISLFRRISFLF